MTLTPEEIQANEAAKKKLQKALQIIKTNGWCQGKYVDEKGACCLSEAIQRSYTSSGYYEARRAIISVIHRNEITWWNDAPGRTQQEVEQALEKAIERLS